MALDSSIILTFNTVGFLTPTYGDLGLMPNASGLSYVVLKNKSQPMTCMISLNVAGNTTLNCSLNVIGNIYSPTINSMNTN